MSADKPPAARPRGGGRSHPREHSRRPRVSLNNFCWHIQSAGCRVPWEHRLANGFPAWADSTPRAAAAPNLWWNVGSKANFARLIREACHGQVTRGIRTHTVYLPARSLTDTGHLCLPDVPKILPACLGVPRGGGGSSARLGPSHRHGGPPLHRQTKQGPQRLTCVANVTLTPRDTHGQTASDRQFPAAPREQRLRARWASSGEGQCRR